jgi:hypothetical protein
MTPTLFLATVLCLAADASAAPEATPVAFEFKDTATYEKRPVLQYRAIDFRNTPMRPLADERKFDAGTLYGLVPVGPKPDTALTIVWRPKAAGGPELWLDADGDGKLTDDERHTMSGRDLEVPATIVVQLEPKRQTVKRTLLFRRSALGDGLRYTVRGYMQGRLELGGKKYTALLIDGNADGCFNSIGRDRVWIDLNGNGRFDPLVEQFPLGKPISHNREVYVVRCDSLASAVVATLRSAGQGKLRIALAKKLAKPATVSAELVSDLGELVAIDKLDEPVSVPFGKYRISSVQLETADAAGQKWTYSFYSEKNKNYTVPKDGQTTISMLGRIDMSVSLSSSDDGKASPGQTISIQPKLLADGSLYLSSCTVGGSSESRRAEGNAEILLNGPDGKTVSRGLTGFS